MFLALFFQLLTFPASLGCTLISCIYEALRLDYGDLALVWQNCNISDNYQWIQMCYISKER